MNDSVYLTLLTVGILALSSSLGAQTTGRIAGQAVDNAGLAVPRAVVTIGNPRLQGIRTDPTNIRGEFRRSPPAPLAKIEHAFFMLEVKTPPGGTWPTKMSAKARKAIGDAQRRRWAAQKAADAASVRKAKN